EGNKRILRCHLRKMLYTIPDARRHTLHRRRRLLFLVRWLFGSGLFGGGRCRLGGVLILGGRLRFLRWSRLVGVLSGVRILGGCRLVPPPSWSRFFVGLSVNLGPSL